MESARSGSAPRHGTEILVLLCAAQFMVILDVAIVNVALPSIKTSLDFSDAGLQWVVNAYTLTFGGLLLLGGRAGDLLGRRRLFLTGIGVFTGASLIGGLAQNEAMLIGARALQGIGGAIVAPTTLAILSTTFTAPADRARAFAAWGAVGGLGGSAGGVLGGVLTDALSWRWILFVNIPVGAVLLWRALRDLPADAPAERTPLRDFDLPGALLVTVGVTALVWGVVRTETVGWTAAETLIVLVAGAGLLIAFVLVEGRVARRPLMPLDVFASRQLSAANGAVFLLGASMFAMWFFLSLYMQEVLGMSAVVTGVAFLPQSAMLILGARNAARIVQKVGITATLAVGFLLAAAGLFLLRDIDADGSWAADVLGPSLLIGLGLGVCMVAVTTAAVSGVDPQRAGLASGLVNVSRQVGGALGLAVLATLATTRTQDLLAGGARPTDAAVRSALNEGYRRAFGIGSIIALAGALVVVAFVRTAAPAPEPPATAAEPAREPEPVG
jgi:EmrB/QacA subfamily drug resistance transporter